ncbi:endonuclease/exonuclease/phosphatase family protein [Nitrosovibrio tenuis]|uniref:Endonuclease/Exonuclease/phosphatase family protein n=1 Tax=Nitrosovibrio tenuis TaxID=1233 RepID=A0A1H7QR31_9PROT|nr:endonuclease/exonuclease/phosphatase family protein [Nitrosovibrio tenuis]SEL50372.1 Endonuclease/Exonuclease/phosphatase family protein [Nitrosovibrio tenuis]
MISLGAFMHELFIPSSCIEHIRRISCFAAILLSGLPACAYTEEISPAQETSPTEIPVASSVPTPVGIAVFNMAWAGTIDDFKRHVEVCSAPEVDWCDSRVKISRGASHPTPEEEARAKKCQEAFIAAAGGFDTAMMIAPCNAYGKHPARAETVENYNLKLDGLRAAVEDLIQNEKIKVIAFQEVKSQETIERVLGKFAGQFDVCAAPHSAFQTVAFAWDKSIPAGANRCTTNRELALAENPGDKRAHRVRPGLALELVIGGSPVTFLNVHLKSGCANLKTAPGFPGHQLTDSEPACTVLNRQIPILEDWIEQIASQSPRFILLGDFNRRIDEEARARIPKAQVRADGSDPAGPNTRDEFGSVKSNYLWQEIADGSPSMYQVRLTSTEPGCTGFKGLDHIVISGPVRRAQAGAPRSSKIALVKSGRQSIATSDHCPRITILEF